MTVTVQNPPHRTSGQAAGALTDAVGQNVPGEGR